MFYPNIGSTKLCTFALFSSKNPQLSFAQVLNSQINFEVTAISFSVVILHWFLLLKRYYACSGLILINFVLTFLCMFSAGC